MDKYKNGVADVHQNIRKLLRRRKPMTANAICRIYNMRYGTSMGTSAMTARFREMKDMNCNRSTNEYELEKGSK